MPINPIPLCPSMNDFPFIEKTFQELELYNLICAVAKKVNELVAQGNTVEQSLTILFNNAIRDGKITANLNVNYNEVTKELILSIGGDI